jgi:hypothetical protein
MFVSSMKLELIDSMTLRIRRFMSQPRVGIVRQRHANSGTTTQPGDWFSG